MIVLLTMICNNTGGVTNANLVVERSNNVVYVLRIWCRKLIGDKVV